MKFSDVLTPILLAGLILVVMVSAALQQQSDKQTQQLLEELISQATGPIVVEKVQPDSSADEQPAEPVEVAIDEPRPADPVEVVVDDPPTDPVEPVETVDPQTTQLSELDWPTFGPTVEQVIRQLLTGQYDAVYSRFNVDMRNALPRQTLAEVVNPLREKHGAFDSILSHAAPAVRLPEGLHAFQVTVATTKATDTQLVFTITLNEEKQIAGLYVR